MENNYYTFTYVIPYIHNTNNFILLKRLTNELIKFSGIEIVIVEQGLNKSLEGFGINYSQYILAYSEEDFVNNAWLCNIGTKYATTNTIVFGRYNYIVDPNAIILGVNTILSGTHETLLLNSYFINLNESEISLEFPDLIKVDTNRKMKANGITDSIFVFSKEAWYNVPQIETLLGSEYNYIMTNIFNKMTKTGCINEAILYKYLSYENMPREMGEKEKKEFDTLVSTLNENKLDVIHKYYNTIKPRLSNENRYFNIEYNIQ